LSKVSTTLGLSSASIAASESEFSISSSSKSSSAARRSGCGPPSNVPWMQTASYGPRRFALGHTTLLSFVLAATARRHHPNPAQAHRRWRGERSKPGRLGVRASTHALFARKVQRKLSNGVAALPPADHLLIERDRGHFVPQQAFYTDVGHHAASPAKPYSYPVHCRRA
jgi:hypothetical protein